MVRQLRPQRVRVGRTDLSDETTRVLDLIGSREKESAMDEPKRDESEAAAEEVEDLDLHADQAEDVKGGFGTTSGAPAPPPPGPVGG